MIRGDLNLPDADGGLEAVRGKGTSWRRLGKNMTAGAPVCGGGVRTARRMKLRFSRIMSVRWSDFHWMKRRSENVWRLEASMGYRKPSWNRLGARERIVLVSMHTVPVA